MPVIGFLRNAPTQLTSLTAFRQGLKEAGFIEGQNVTVDYRWNDRDQLTRLVGRVPARRPVAVIVANQISALAAKAATATVPIVFATGADPIRAAA